MAKIQLLVKKNSDGSFSAAVRADLLEKFAFVDFYNESTGKGYQRNETQRAKRGRDIEGYIRRCVAANTRPALFEMTANARVCSSGWAFESLDDSDELGFLTFDSEVEFLSMIDGGTRLLGIMNALDKKLTASESKFDVRIFIGLSVAAEIAYFLLINDTQKKVRTDLGLRVVQRLLDENKLTDQELEFLRSAVPETESWKYDAIRMASALNNDQDGKWYHRIQMPGQGPRCSTLQAFFSSLQMLLNDADVKLTLAAAADRGELMVDGQSVDPTQFLTRVVRNFWDAVALVNPDADSEADTTVLWAPIGANSHHIALSKVLASLLATNDFDFSIKRFADMIRESQSASYEFWYTKAGSKKSYYPKEKGDAPTMTGVANYKRLADVLEKEWRAKLHADVGKGPISV